METILIILGVLGFGAVLISVYVFATAARNYVSDAHSGPLYEQDENQERLYVVRSNVDRRHTPGTNVEFPLQLQSGEIIAMERRLQPERRQLQTGP